CGGSTTNPAYNATVALASRRPRTFAPFPNPRVSTLPAKSHNLMYRLPPTGMPPTRTKPAKTKLVICVWHPFTFWRPQPVMPETIRRRWPEMRVMHLPDYDRLPEELPDTDIFIGYSLRPEQLRYAKNLKWIHSTAAGVAQLMYPELRDSGIMVTNPSGIFSVPMAEHVIGLMLALARNFPDSVRYHDRS